ncbi:polyribonucleotide nucleotidyltransferase, partial [Burkholderia multivorans]
PNFSQLDDAVFDMVVAGRMVGDDVAIMMVEAEATDQALDLVKTGAKAPTEEVVAEGLEAAKPFIAELCRAQQELADLAAKPTVEFPVFRDYQDDVFEAVKDLAEAKQTENFQIADKQEREAAGEELLAELFDKLGERFEGRE